MTLKNKNIAGHQKGFTVIELLIATTVFSLVMLLAVASVLQITRMYYRGVTQARVQEAARTIIDEIGESYRLSQEDISNINLVGGGPDIVPADPDTGFFCLGSKRYTFAIDRQLKESPAASTRQKRHVMWVDKPAGGCLAAADLSLAQPSVDGREVLSENMRLTRFDITNTGWGGGPDTYRFTIGVAYGDDDLLVTDGPTKTCKSALTGGEFCATSQLSVTVTKRL